MDYAVIKAAGYVLAHTPDLVMRNGIAQLTEGQGKIQSEYIAQLPSHLRSYQDVVNYSPNQVFIGNMKPEDLNLLEKPWASKLEQNADRYGNFGQIIPQDEFIALLKLADVFDLVKIDYRFLKRAKEAYKLNPTSNLGELDKLEGSETQESILELLDKQQAEPVYHQGELIGCIKQGHDLDPNLSGQILLENLVTKASGALALKEMLRINEIDPAEIDYVIECSEEACGDMYQRGGGNFAKSIAEMVGAVNATGCDLRGFCAAPVHALVTAASLVRAGTYRKVAVVAGGTVAKLGMNGKEHIRNGLPILEDVIGGFALLITQNDGHSPVIRTDLVGKHDVGTGSSPQSVMNALVGVPTERAGLKITDIDKYSVEMQNPDITLPAGSGDVPEANYKMIAAIGVKRGEVDRYAQHEFIEKHGLPGWAPTQGHIPSGIPYIGFALTELTTGTMNRIMIVGKGSLFLGRMTNLFDGISVMLERNDGEIRLGSHLSKEEINKLIAEAMRGLAGQLLGQ